MLSPPPRGGWRPPTPDAAALRVALGLPTDRAVVMAGHQPTLWHPGILAKWLAVAHAARAFDAVPAWVVVDHDAVDPLVLRVPTRDPAGALAVETLRFGGAPPPARDTPALAIPASAAHGFTRRGSIVPECAAIGLDTVEAALRSHADAPNAAMQATRAVRDLAQRLFPALPTMAPIPASTLGVTERFRCTLDRFRAPDASEAYARAARANPRAGIRPLAPGELPAWVIDGARRRPHRVDEKIPAGSATLAPRALLLTFLLRSGACDLFVHGTGGAGHDGLAGYDRVMEAWARELFPGDSLAPTAVATATLLLPFPGGRDSPRERALWEAHRAPHDPTRVGDGALAREKASALDRLASLPRKSAARRDAYRDLHALLASYRDRRAADLATIHTRAADARRSPSDWHVRHDRTWAFPLHPRGALEALSNAVAARLEGR